MNQILKKYSSNKRLKKISSVKFTLPSQVIQFNHGKIKLPCLKMEIDFNKNKEKIKQIEWDETYAYISCEIKEEAKFSCDSWIEVDLNTTGHLLVASHPQTGKILKLGKKRPSYPSKIQKY